jgi:BirA family transcriptional regulator, biotin operon repressor / biotin---[acetyl-CoA-carboxylase] ligase
LYKIPANTLFLGKNLVFVPECHSTNTLGLQLVSSPSTAEGTVIITNNQTAGRGQRGNTWEAEAGLNLTFSVVLKPQFLSIKDQFYLTIVAALAVRDYLKKKIADKVHIKWPNDILAAGKKICGILIENQLQGNVILSAVVGIGLNVNQISFTNEQRGSIKGFTGVETDLQESLEDLLSCLEARYLQLRQNHLKELKDAYLSGLYWRNEVHTFSSGDTTFEGTIRAIDETGKLQLETAGAMKFFGIKEITYLN